MCLFVWRKGAVNFKPSFHMKKALIILSLGIVCFSGCKKDDSLSAPKSDLDKGKFVIGSDDFYKNFREIPIKNDDYFLDVTYWVKQINLDESDKFDITIIDYSYDTVYDNGRGFQKGQSLGIYSSHILTEKYPDQLIQTRNASRDSVFVANKNTQDKGLEVLDYTLPFDLDIPRFFVEGDSVNWERDFVENDGYGIINQYRNEQIINSDEVKSDQRLNTDILGANPKFVVIKYTAYPPGIDSNHPNGYVLGMEKYGLIEISLQSDSTLKIHRIFSQK